MLQVEIYQRKKSDVPDCRLCTKRRIKCDRSIPQCRKCAIRELSCPGFDPVNLRWDQGVASRGKLAGRNLPVPRRGESTAALNTFKNDAPSVTTSGHGPRPYATASDGSQPSDSFLYATDPMRDLGLVTRSSSAVLFDFLLGHFHLEVASRLRWIDSPDNPWRSFVIPLAEQSTCLRLSVLSLAATHLAATSAGESHRVPALLQVNHNLREASLRALNEDIRSELNRDDDISREKLESTSLIEMLATMLVLCYGEMLIPDSTDWNLHLHACRTVVDRHNLCNWREASQDPVTKFLIKDVVDLEAFGTFSVFTREQMLSTTVSPQSILDGHFWTFTNLICEVTALERERYGLLQDGQQPPDTDMSFWRAKIEQAYTRASDGALSLQTPAERERFGAVIRAHYHASLIYGYQALAPPIEAIETISSVMTLLFHEIESITAEPMPAFCHDMFFPLFIAGTECRTDGHRQNMIETLFVQLISASGFWCNQAALRFLRAFWAKPADSESWIQYARENEHEFGPFLVF